MTRPLNRDLMNNANPILVGRAAMTVIDRLQDFDPETQAVGFAAGFLMLAKRFNVQPQDLFETAQNVMNGMDGKRPEFKAVESYLGVEL